MIRKTVVGYVDKVWAYWKGREWFEIRDAIEELHSKWCSREVLARGLTRDSRFEKKPVIVHGRTRMLYRVKEGVNE